MYAFLTRQDDVFVKRCLDPIERLRAISEQETYRRWALTLSYCNIALLALAFVLPGLGHHLFAGAGLGLLVSVSLRADAMLNLRLLKLAESSSLVAPTNGPRAA
jgi:predicted anti-sigma-YlaC factor YlaD